jgi:protein TonB
VARIALFRGFPLGFEISVVLHVVVVAAIWAILHFHGHGVTLPPMHDPFKNAVAISMEPPPKPQPKPMTPPTPHEVTPVTPAIASESPRPTQATTPPVKNPPPPTTPPAEEQPEQQANPDYQMMVESILDANKRYPRQAVMSGTEGTVELQFTLNNQGTVLTYTIEKSSGSEALDNEVKRMVRAARFPPFPQGDTSLRKTVNVTIEFTLGAGTQP